jgi:cytochrome c oxidase subunit 2
MVVLMRVVTIGCFIAAVAVGGAARGWHAEAGQPAMVIIDVAAERFSFTPSEIRATVGVPLHIRLQSDDTAHGFRIVGTDLNVEIPKRSRGTVTVTFTPERAGRYTFECSKLCGAGHSFMRGVIIVDDPEAR